jgi:Domain of Unknown Function (DUF1543)
MFPPWLPVIGHRLSTYDGGVDDPTGPKLFAVYLGGDPAPGRLTEDHEVVHVVATDIKDARAAAKAKWTGVAPPHIDAVRLLRVVDGHLVGLERTGERQSDDIDGTYEPQDS